MTDTPAIFACTYHIKRGSSIVGQLRGVINEPMFGATINGGMDPLALDLDHYPSELHLFDLVRVDLPDGTVAGLWKHEEQAANFDATTRTYKLTLVPLVSELSEAGLTANYTTDPTQVGTPLGPADPATWTAAGLAQTAHCTAGTVEVVGLLYPYAFNRAQPIDALNQHTLFGGAGWWWFCNGVGKVDVRDDSPTTHVLTRGREYTGGEQHIDTHGLPNIQPVTGGTPAGGSKALEGLAQDLTGHPYSVDVIGRRQAQAYSDSALLTQAACDTVAATLLATLERPTITRKVKVEGYVGPWLLPGDAVTLREGFPDPAGDALADVTPTLIVHHSVRTGATGTYDLELVDMPSVVRSGGGSGVMTGAVALGSMVHNPAQLASILPYSFGLQPVDATYRARCRFQVPSNVILVTKALLSFSTGPFRSGIQTASGGTTSGDEGAHTHDVGLPSHSHGTPNHSHGTPDHRHVLFTFNGAGAGVGNQDTYDYWDGSNGWPIVLTVLTQGTVGPNVETRNAGGGGTTPAGGGGTSGGGGGTVVASAAGSAHHHTIPPESLNPPSALFEAGMAQGCHVWIDGTDRTTALSGPFGGGSPTDIDDLDITAWLLTSGFHEIQLSSTALGGIMAQVTVFAVLGAS
jgi:hypothetical protein